ncbi:ribbon-helix-helix domain-containing protein [Castellaniella sp.]|jgi:predicted DNA-binding ribbon-helix-helix protein|uniref:ribbon-helix-helix domain-containing protein n=1 Tax=Castellaniella sp. TaxID=1955812 RepID=UPI003A95B0B0
MCHIYSSTDPILYESRSRSVRIDRVVTSIKLENLFWDILSQMAHEESITTNQLISRLHDEVFANGHEVANFASFLRVTCLRYFELRCRSIRDAGRVLERSASVPEVQRVGTDVLAAMPVAGRTLGWDD